MEEDPKMKIAAFAATLALSTALAFAQAPKQKAVRAVPVVEQISQRLNLTDDQKQQARQILVASARDSRGLHRQIRDTRSALVQAAKTAGSDAQIDKLSAELGTLTTQATAIRMKTFSKLYAILTPEQQAQVGDNPAALLGKGNHTVNQN